MRTIPSIGRAQTRSRRCGEYARGVQILLAVLLLVNAAYNVIVWPRFFQRISKDARARSADGTRTAFFRVHAVLIGIALVLAGVSAVAGVWALVTL